MNSPVRRRLVFIDALRGVAILLMVVYHFCFDLSHFRLADFDFYNDPFWLNFRTLILSMFLLLVGVSLVLASRKTLDTRRYLNRLGLLLGSAMLVTVSTWWMFGDRFVFFGVLHFIALASVLGLLFLRAGWLNLVLGIVLVAVGSSYQSSWFDEPGRRWIGLMTHKPATEDYVPLLPWFGVVLLGLFVGPWLYRLAQRWQGMGDFRVAQWLAFSGRHSLLIYMLHQPLMIGALTLLT
ncbi:MAG TPA: DUF1624 domain-containing protein [Gammaproteobacteria bacterium]|nr:DUF1624 domain-containing protein [Gammaproteobacteria bacterium]